jgi:transcriptional regulator with XRE-family HTH domain
MSGIGDRARESLGQLSSDMRHRDVAEQIGMTPDAFSRALNGKRQFSSIELARLAELLEADLHWLITGQADPNRLQVAARHKFDHSTRLHTIPGLAGDEQVLADIALAYRQAYPDPENDAKPGMAVKWPRSAAEAQDILGHDFVRNFAGQLERYLGLGVIRVAELSTAYSFAVGSHTVVALPATANWFRENWDLAHEVGHIVEGHHADGISEHEADKHEAAANAFAAELLLPAALIKDIRWDELPDGKLALYVWNWGISTDALYRRICSLLGDAPARIAHWASGPTQRLLRRHLPVDSELDEITARMDEAAQRRFPLRLQEAHLNRVASGAIGKATLAWMLGIDAAALEVDSPEIPEVDADELASALGL